LHSCPPKSQPLGQGYEPAVLKTTNQLAYTPKPVSPPKKSVHSSQELTTEEFPFEGESTGTDVGFFLSTNWFFYS
jgi:hypothetical protein